jgi:hypothetical protein
MSAILSRLGIKNYYKSLKCEILGPYGDFGA